MNHGAIAEAYRALGCSVADTSMVGFGYPDLNIGLVGVTELVEVKSPEGVLGAAQERFARDWRGSAVRIIRTAAEAAEHVQEIRRRVKGK
jgi:hypothetical protein